jgi:DNA-binding NtrC family response regulator
VLVNQGRFLEDLYFVFAPKRIQLPPLRDRREDLDVLARHFMESDQPVSSGLLRELSARSWPGNVRELRDFIRRMDEQNWRAMRTLTEQPASVDDSVERYRDRRLRVVDQFDREYLAQLAKRTGRDIRKMAAIAGLDRGEIQRLLRIQKL